jgi:hypothetical protein
MTALPPFTATRLEKAARDNGFDLTEPSTGDWLAFASSKAPLRIWLSMTPEGRPLAALAQRNVAEALAGLGAPAAGAPLPPGAVAILAAADFTSLHPLLRRAFQLSRTLPDELLHRFERETATLLKSTEAERLAVVRVGQDLFRAGLMDYWDGRCAVTGLAVPELLRASHIKPWARCDSDAERLDVFNGFLLAPHLDAAFDRGFITIADDGAVLISPALGAEAQAILGLDKCLCVAALVDRHRAYLSWHRAKLFQQAELPQK